MRGLDILATTHLSRKKIFSIAKKDKEKLKNYFSSKSLPEKFFIVKFRHKPFFIPFFVWAFFILLILEIEIDA